MNSIFKIIELLKAFLLEIGEISFLLVAFSKKFLSSPSNLESFLDSATTWATNHCY